MRLLLALLAGLFLAAFIVFAAERAMAPATGPVPVPAVAAPASPVGSERPGTADARPPTAQALWAQARQVAWPALQAKAEAGDAEAQFRRGMATLLGSFGEPDAAEGRRWLSRAAEQGHARASNALGELLALGEFAEPDYPKATAYFQAAWKAGEPMGLVNLGILAEEGAGRSKDAAEALRCFRQAADKGCAAALVRLGVISHDGDLLPKDDRQAVVYYRQAAEKGSKEGWMNLAIAHQRGLGTPRDPSAALDCARQAWNLGMNEAAYLVVDRLLGDGGDPAEAAGYLLAVSTLDDSAESLAQVERRKGPWLDGLSPEAMLRSIATSDRLLEAEGRRRLQEIFGR
jgi:TPR repeat protein